MSKMFKKLDGQVKKVKAVKKALSVSPAEKQKLEESLIFGNLLESLDAQDIEESYKEEKTSKKLEDAKHVKAWKATGVYAYEDGSYKYLDGKPASKEDIEKYNSALKN